MRFQTTDTLIDPDDGMSDETLVKEAAALGNMDAFAELYRRYVSTVRGYLFKRIFDAEPLDDLVQDAFLEALKTAGEYYENPKDLAVGQWLCGCAGRALRRERWARFAYKKAANVCVGLMIRSLRDEMTPWTADPSDPNGNVPTEVTDQHREAIANLRPHYREAIELHYLDGLTLAETAAAMGRKGYQVTYILQVAADELRDPDGYKRTTRAPYDAADKWARLLVAAREVIAEVGVAKARGALIAKRAGLNQSHINLKFGSRDGLIRAALSDSVPGEVRGEVR
jgi:RNA polymerase sigma factor (sigma-70 family)